MGLKSYTELRNELAAAQRTFLETDLTLLVTFADMARRHYQQGDSQHGDRCMSHAETAIKTVRYFSATTDLLAGAEVHVLARRCDKLERIVSTVKPAK
jgi:hypothetical protein